MVSREQWLEARKLLLAQEKEQTRRQDALNGDCRQLIIHHIMFGPDWDEPCPSCRNFMAELSVGLIGHLHDRDTAFALVSRAPRAKIDAYQASRGWAAGGPVSVASDEGAAEVAATWYSSYGSDFNYDFEVTLDESRAQYNYRAEPGLLGGRASTEMPGTSCFLRDGETVFHNYSAYGRAMSTPVASIRCST